MQRLRRLRKSSAFRELVAETAVKKRGLILPVFVCEGKDIREPVPSMPGVFRYSVDRLEEIAEGVRRSGIGGVMLFGVPDHKDETGSGAYADDGVVQRALRFLRGYLKRTGSEFLLIADICLCEYTSHGHCGILCGGEVDNDKSLPYHAAAALSCVKAGADMVAPSSMMDGAVAAIRALLDENGYENTPIMGYSAKFASAFYGPFRDAADSAPQSGNRKGYQMDYRNGREALREAETDMEEGADIVMVKPGLAYLDVLSRVAEISDRPVAVYNVSGEYSMVKAAAQAGWIDERAIVIEEMTAFFRAGADIVITYHALDYVKWTEGKQ